MPDLGQSMQKHCLILNRRVRQTPLVQLNSAVRAASIEIRQAGRTGSTAENKDLWKKFAQLCMQQSPQIQTANRSYSSLAVTHIQIGRDCTLPRAPGCTSFTCDHSCRTPSSSGHSLRGMACLATAAARSAIARRTMCTGSWAMRWSRRAWAACLACESQQHTCMHMLRRLYMHTACVQLSTQSMPAAVTAACKWLRLTYLCLEAVSLANAAADNADDADAPPTSAADDAKLTSRGSNCHCRATLLRSSTAASWRSCGSGACWTLCNSSGTSSTRPDCAFSACSAALLTWSSLDRHAASKLSRSIAFLSKALKTTVTEHDCHITMRSCTCMYPLEYQGFSALLILIHILLNNIISQPHYTSPQSCQQQCVYKDEHLKNRCSL